MTEKELRLTEKERKQIEFQRALKYGKLIVHIEASQPVRIEEALKNILL